MRWVTAECDERLLAEWAVPDSYDVLRPTQAFRTVKLLLSVALFLSTFLSTTVSSRSALDSDPLKKIGGTVRDSTGASIPGARITVTVMGSATPTRTVFSDASGDFSVEVPQNTYLVCSDQRGFVEKCLRVSVQRGNTRNLAFVLGVIQPPMQPRAKILDNALRQLAGSDARNCGRVRLSGSPTLASQCVLQQFQKRRAFLVRYDLPGIDSEVAAGLAGNGRNVSAFLFDSFGTSPDGAPKEAVFSHNNRLVLIPCPEPAQLRPTESGRVTCFRPDQSADPFLHDW